MIEHIEYFSTLPYKVNPDALYTPLQLFDEFRKDDPTSLNFCYDTRVYLHMHATGKITPMPMELAARAMHDCHMRNHMQALLDDYEPQQVVGIMGGHSMKRTDEAYRLAANVSKRLTEMGRFMISGGGPGAMEATHLGAWMAERTEAEMNDAVSTLSQAPTYHDDEWLATAFEVCEKYPLITKHKSLAIPTWFYGHEPPCRFATHIAKFFDNSVREDLLLTVAYGGLIYMPGSAGTVQEVFQEICQDHYLTLGYASPMVFVGSDYWTHEVPVLPFIEHMMQKGLYKNLIVHVANTEEEIIEAITKSN